MWGYVSGDKLEERGLDVYGFGVVGVWGGEWGRWGTLAGRGWGRVHASGCK